MTKTLPWGEAHAAPPLSATLLHFVAHALQAASAALDRVATRVAQREAAAGTQTVEFYSLHREAGAPEGALYINGEFVGVIEGVTRL